MYETYKHGNGKLSQISVGLLFKDSPVCLSTIKLGPLYRPTRLLYGFPLYDSTRGWNYQTIPTTSPSISKKLGSSRAASNNRIILELPLGAYSSNYTGKHTTLTTSQYLSRERLLPKILLS